MIKKIIFFSFLLLSTFSFSQKAYQTGIASFYGEKWNGRKTANGEIYNTYKLTAAHRELPFGTVVRVTNLSNGKYVDVLITDRGPYINGRIIDLSKKAFETIGDLEKGLLNVKLTIIRGDK